MKTIKRPEAGDVVSLKRPADRETIREAIVIEVTYIAADRHGLALTDYCVFDFISAGVLGTRTARATDIVCWHPHGEVTL